MNILQRINGWLKILKIYERIIESQSLFFSEFVVYLSLFVGCWSQNLHLVDECKRDCSRAIVLSPQYAKVNDFQTLMLVSSEECDQRGSSRRIMARNWRVFIIFMTSLCGMLGCRVQKKGPEL